MRFSVDAWDPGYGTSLGEEELVESSAPVVLDVEVPESAWAPRDPAPGTAPPGAVLFVDGVRRVEARAWIHDSVPPGEQATSALPALCASYASGVVCCCAAGAHLAVATVRRGTFTAAAHAGDVRTTAGDYPVRRTRATDPVGLSLALQRALGELEVESAAAARAQLGDHPTGGHHTADPAGDDPAGGTDLLVVDGPLRGRQHLPRTLGFVKTHQSAYLPPRQHAMVGTLGPGQRTPVFLMGTSWDRHSWYLRLPGGPGAPWAGVVRVECGADMSAAEAIALADQSQVTLRRFASTEFKDARAPQNLYPIAGLERALRRRMGDPQLLYRALRRAAVH
ncbi:hypothetical protein [Frankia sp. Mgl5]|uniref:hypothetical protein n=1 Tax=Frankia sp. Mgl5 TaxID=2933793 RepID=UPI00200BFC12|nr:hypothetical protein [Frankia sp. Mgl5]